MTMSRYNTNVDINAHDAFTRCAQDERLECRLSLKSLGEINQKGINRIVIIGYGHLYLVEENLSFNTEWTKQLPQAKYGQMSMYFLHGGTNSY